jgi:small subunit ribosomal protein S16
MVNPVELKLDTDKLQVWLDRGAQPSNTVKSLLKQHQAAQ